MEYLRWRPGLKGWVGWVIVVGMTFAATLVFLYLTIQPIIFGTVYDVWCFFWELGNCLDVSFSESPILFSFSLGVYAIVTVATAASTVYFFISHPNRR